MLFGKTHELESIKDGEGIIIMIRYFVCYCNHANLSIYCLLQL